MTFKHNSLIYQKSSKHIFQLNFFAVNTNQRLLYTNVFEHSERKSLGKKFLSSQFRSRKL